MQAAVGKPVAAFAGSRLRLTSRVVLVILPLRGVRGGLVPAFVLLSLSTMSQKILVIDDSLSSSRAAETALSQNFGNVDVLLAQREQKGSTGSWWRNPI